MTNFFELPVVENSISIGAVMKSDIEQIRLWRNSQMPVLRQSTPITQAQQLKYWEKKVWPEYSKPKPSQLLVSIRDARTSVLKGYGGITNIDWYQIRGEVSFLVDPQLEELKNIRSELFANFLVAVTRLAFEVLDLGLLFTETYTFRKDHIDDLERFGFRVARAHEVGASNSDWSIFHVYRKEGL